MDWVGLESPLSPPKTLPVAKLAIIIPKYENCSPYSTYNKNSDSKKNNLRKVSELVSGTNQLNLQ